MPTLRVGEQGREYVTKICDRSPCDGLLSALGHFIFGSPDGFYISASSQDHVNDVDIDYCPFCGTRLEEVPPIVLQRFMKPRKRRRVSKALE